MHTNSNKKQEKKKQEICWHVYLKIISELSNTAVASWHHSDRNVKVTLTVTMELNSPSDEKKQRGN